MDKISNGIEALGFGKWFQDNVDPVDLESFDIARVIAVHKDSYVINNGEKDVYADDLDEKRKLLHGKVRVMVVSFAA